ncbi:hypothetical protein LPJ53_006331, partial [Coemansia erecta]
MSSKRKATDSLDDSSDSTQSSQRNNENEPADPNSADVSVMRSSKSRPRLLTSVDQESAISVPIVLSRSQEQPRTPEQRSHPQLSNPHSSPIKVTGRNVSVNSSFADSGSADVCKVDKSLLCMEFWQSVKNIGKICLPRRSGKTYNLTQMLLFFSILPEAIKLTDIPDSFLADDETNADQVAGMRLAEKCRAKREQLFSSSLLKSNHPEFYKEHFMKYPVVNISFAKCIGATLGNLILDLCKTVETAASQYILLIDEYDIPFVIIDVADWDIDTKNRA